MILNGFIKVTIILVELFTKSHLKLWNFGFLFFLIKNFTKTIIIGKTSNEVFKFFFCFFFKYLKINQSWTVTCRWSPQTVQKLPFLISWFWELVFKILVEPSRRWNLRTVQKPHLETRDIYALTHRVWLVSIVLLLFCRSY